VAINRHASWRAFEDWRGREGLRLVLATTKGAVPYASFGFARDDAILLGRESAGVPDEVHAAADARIIVPMCPGMRSLNVAVAAAMILGEALRQTGGFPRGLRSMTGHE
jgi:tRNA (cytidine/uridine-2'-O-)-methyltransferase